MTEEENNVDIITKTPEKSKEKIKDPKLVELGKKLALYNKEAKEAKEAEIKNRRTKRI